jgi:hypothetical protein
MLETGWQRLHGWRWSGRKPSISEEQIAESSS